MDRDAAYLVSNLCPRMYYKVDLDEEPLSIVSEVEGTIFRGENKKR